MTKTHKNGTPKDDMFIGIGPANDKYSGKAGDDFIDGKLGNDTLRGGTGDDQVIGGAGNDKLYGDDGKDSLWGGTERDTLTGGGGSDVFLFYVDGLFGQGSDIDIVKDFAAGGKEHDYIAIVAVPGGEEIKTFDDIADNMSQHGKNVHIAFDTGDTMIIENTKVKALTSDHFTFEM